MHCCHRYHQLFVELSAQLGLAAPFISAPACTAKQIIRADSVLTLPDTACHALTQLSYEVKQHKACSQEVATAPSSLNVVSLLIPLEPHADAIFQKGADETQTCQVGQVLFGYPQELAKRGTEEEE